MKIGLALAPLERQRVASKPACSPAICKGTTGAPSGIKLFVNGNVASSKRGAVVVSEPDGFRVVAIGIDHYRVIV